MRPCPISIFTIRLLSLSEVQDRVSVAGFDSTGVPPTKAFDRHVQPEKFHGFNHFQWSVPMLRNTLFYTAAALTALSACTGTMISVVRKRATFDLECPAQNLTITELSARTFGVEGCQKRATYLTQGECSMESSCAAVLNSPKTENR
jgi:hypothetical protein